MTPTRPYIICHMMSSIDGRIDCAMCEYLDDTDTYSETLLKLDTPSHLSGKITMAMHNAMREKFVSKDKTPVGKSKWMKNAYTSAYTISVDNKGELIWEDRIVEDLPLICVLPENVSVEYTQYLNNMGISWITAGKNRVDLTKAVEILYRVFEIERLAVVGGGTINGAFLKEGLLDEISVVIGPGIDGRKGQRCMFDGLGNDFPAPEIWNLFHVEQIGQDVWLRYINPLLVPEEPEVVEEPASVEEKDTTEETEEQATTDETTRTEEPATEEPTAMEESAPTEEPATIEETTTIVGTDVAIETKVVEESVTEEASQPHADAQPERVKESQPSIEIRPVIEGPIIEMSKVASSETVKPSVTIEETITTEQPISAEEPRPVEQTRTVEPIDFEVHISSLRQPELGQKSQTAEESEQPKDPQQKRNSRQIDFFADFDDND